MSTTKPQPAYVPGVCNINYAEIKQRRQLGHVGVAVFVVVAIILIALNVDRYDRIVLLLPAFLAANGYLQARNHFCVGYAASGKQNAEEGSLTAVEVVEAEARKADKHKARAINVQSFAIALVIALIAVALPQ